MPQEILTKFLVATDLVMPAAATDDANRIGIGMDSAVIPLLRQPGLSVVQTVDFFYPLVDDPETMGRIALANVCSDMYAVGVTHIDKITVIISVPLEFSDHDTAIVVPLIVKGFAAAAAEAGCQVRIGNVAVNPWCIIGGVATAICADNEIIL